MARRITKGQFQLYNKYKLAKIMREEKATEAEKLMWGHIERVVFPNLPRGCLIHRQSVIGDFIVDFCCETVKVILEVDGLIHQSKRLKDHYRDEYLMRHGWLVLRVRNEDVYDYNHAVAIARRLLYLCRSRLNRS